PRLSPWARPPPASLSRSARAPPVMRLNSGSGPPSPPATARAYCECPYVRFIASGTRTWACTSITIGLGVGPLDCLAAPRIGLSNLERGRRVDVRERCLGRLSAVGIDVLLIAVRVSAAMRPCGRVNSLWSYFGGIIGASQKDSFSPPE